MTLHDRPVAESLAAWRASWPLAGVTEPVATETLELEEAVGAALAERLVAVHPSPPFRCAAMDGVAVVTADLPGTISPDRFQPVDTGQPVPDRFDAVVPTERLTIAPDGAVLVAEAVEEGANIRMEGEDVPAGTTLLEPGRLLSPYHVALAAACGHATLLARRPVVAVLTTGEEVRPAGSALAAGEIADSNGPMLLALARTAGAIALRATHVTDHREMLVAAIRQAAETSDLVLVVAGSARGRRDHTRSAIAEAGLIAVDGVAVRPGHPVLLGVVDRTPVIGVPGYPASAAFTFRLFAEPALDALRGSAPRSRLATSATAAVEIRGHPLADCLVPVTVLDGRATPLSRRGGALRSLALADGVVSLPAGATIAAGQPVSVERL